MRGEVVGYLVVRERVNQAIVPDHSQSNDRSGSSGLFWVRLPKRAHLRRDGLPGGIGFPPKQAAALENYQGSMLLPGIKISTGPWNFRPIKHLRLIQFDGRTWQPIGDVLETAFSNAQK